MKDVLTGLSEEEALPLAQAVDTLRQAWADPEVREIIRARERYQEEKQALLDQALQAGQSARRIEGEVSPEVAAVSYVQAQVASWTRRYPFEYGEPSAEVLADEEKLHWWHSFRKRSEIDYRCELSMLKERLISNFMAGAGSRP